MESIEELQAKRDASIISYSEFEMNAEEFEKQARQASIEGKRARLDDLCEAHALAFRAKMISMYLIHSAERSIVLTRKLNEVHESLEKGLAQSAAGDVVYLGPFAKYLEDD